MLLDGNSAWKTIYRLSTSTDKFTRSRQVIRHRSELEKFKESNRFVELLFNKFNQIQQIIGGKVERLTRWKIEIHFGKMLK